MILAMSKITDFDQFLQTFSTMGAEKRSEHGCNRSSVFRDPDDAGRVWVAFDWDMAGWQKFAADPDVQAIFATAGLQQPPVAIEAVATYDV
jgi:quinol monooxygenase YgiN